MEKRKRDQPLANAETERRAQAAVARIIAEKSGAWGGVLLQDEWMVGVIVRAFVEPEVA